MTRKVLWPLERHWCDAPYPERIIIRRSRIWFWIASATAMLSRHTQRAKAKQTATTNGAALSYMRSTWQKPHEWMKRSFLATKIQISYELWNPVPLGVHETLLPKKHLFFIWVFSYAVCTFLLHNLGHRLERERWKEWNWIGGGTRSGPIRILVYLPSISSITRFSLVPHTRLLYKFFCWFMILSLKFWNGLVFLDTDEWC